MTFVFHQSKPLVTLKLDFVIGSKKIQMSLIGLETKVQHLPGGQGRARITLQEQVLRNLANQSLKMKTLATFFLSFLVFSF